MEDIAEAVLDADVDFVYSVVLLYSELVIYSHDKGWGDELPYLDVLVVVVEPLEEGRDQVVLGEVDRHGDWSTGCVVQRQCLVA